MSPVKSSILLCDNGSRRPQATLMLREIARQLAQSCGRTVDPVSLQHADAIDARELDGQPARVLPEYLRSQLQEGIRSFYILPLFFGNSRALTSFIPDQHRQLQAEFGDFEVHIAPVLYPLPEGDPNLCRILQSNIDACRDKADDLPVVLVDHGSPVAAVGQVRQTLATQLQQLASLDVEQACMERRAGEEYDFNGPLLADWLREKARQGASGAVIAMLFLLPGKHAGEGGDVATICRDALADYPDFDLCISPLVGEHPQLIEMLLQRLSVALAGSA